VLYHILFLKWRWCLATKVYSVLANTYIQIESQSNPSTFILELHFPHVSGGKTIRTSSYASSRMNQNSLAGHITWSQIKRWPKVPCWNRAGDFKQVFDRLKNDNVMLLLSSSQIDAPLLLLFPAVLLLSYIFVILFLSLSTLQLNCGFICSPCPPINLSSLRVEIMGRTLHSLMPRDDVLMKRRSQSLSIQIEVALPAW